MVKRVRSDVDFERIINRLESKQVSIGYFETSHYEDGKPIAYIAAIHEMGAKSKGIPARPTLNPALTSNMKKYREHVSSSFKLIVDGSGSVDVMLEQIGQVAAGDVQTAIKELVSPKLSEATLKTRKRRNKKGLFTTKPLVDTGQMIQAVTYRVEAKK